jgi:hypothetical protein
VDTAKPKRVRAIKLKMPLRLVGPKHGRKNWLTTIITVSRRRERGPASTNKTKSPALITNQGRLIEELVSSVPNYQTLVVSRFREKGLAGPLSIQQPAVASRWPAEAAWSESFRPSPVTPPRGFSFAAIRYGETMLLIYSVHFKSNRGDATSNIGKRKEAARQLLAHVAEMERVYSQNAKIVTVIAGDFNTDPTDARFATEETFALLREKFVWSWENVPLSERVTNPAKGR